MQNIGVEMRGYSMVFVIEVTFELFTKNDSGVRIYMTNKYALRSLGSGALDS